MVTIEELAEMDECPCEICTSQDDDDKVLKREKMKEIDEACDLFSNQIIDLLLDNPDKYILKRQIKEDKVE